MKKWLLWLAVGCFSLQVVLAQSYLPERNNRRMLISPVIGLGAYGFNLRDVRLTGNGPFKHAMDIDGGYILSLKPDRLLHRFFKNSGLTPKDSVYGGWESDGLSGHTLGHYLSAASMMYASTGNAAFKERVDYVIAQLAFCQEARKTGYVGAIPNEDSIFYPLQRGVIKSGGFDLNGGWSPWYTVHKLMAGLVDAWLYADNAQALVMVRKMADWTARIVDPLTDTQRQQMLRCEYGGMADVLANIYAITGEKKYLTLSYKFYDDFVMQPMSEQKDVLSGKHSNTNIPKAIGSARQFELTARPSDSTLASFFWHTMVEHHSYVTGGNGNYEYLGEPDKLSHALGDNTTESCCTYNMLKLTGHLFTWHPDARLGDYYERALFNDILASQHPVTAMMLYFEPLRMGGKKEFSDSTNTFTCCVGSGMENHAKYAEDIFFEGRDGSLYVNLFIAARLHWKSRDCTIEQITKYPAENHTQLVIKTSKSQTFKLRIRTPRWAKSPVLITVRGRAIPAQPDADGFMVVKRTWKNNEIIDIEFPMSLYAEKMPDDSNRIAILYGPLVLAGNLGDTMPDPIYGTPVLLTDNHHIDQWITRDESHPLLFRTHGVGKPVDVSLSPFYQQADNYYSVYWDFFSGTDWQNREVTYEAEKKEQRAVEAQTIDVMRLGQMQPERDHELQASEQSYSSDAFGRTGREVRHDGYFSFKLRTDSAAKVGLLCTYLGDDDKRRFDILIDGVVIADVTLEKGTTGKFYDVVYPIPPNLLQGKSLIEVKFQATHGRTAGRVFGCRTMRLE